MIILPKETKKLKRRNNKPGNVSVDSEISPLSPTFHISRVKSAPNADWYQFQIHTWRLFGQTERIYIRVTIVGLERTKILVVGEDSKS